MKKVSFRNDVLPLKNQLYRLALRITLNSAEAEDIVQDTMMKVWNRRERWDEIESMEAFCLTICRNLALDRMKKAENQNDSLDKTMEQQPDRASSPYEQAVSQDRIQLVREIINTLPEKQRSCVQLRDIEGKAYKEIAEILSITEEQVKVNIFRARQTAAWTGRTKLLSPALCLRSRSHSANAGASGIKTRIPCRFVLLGCKSITPRSRSTALHSSCATSPYRKPVHRAIRQAPSQSLPIRFAASSIADSWAGTNGSPRSESVSRGRKLDHGLIVIESAACASVRQIADKSDMMLIRVLLLRPFAKSAAYAAATTPDTASTVCIAGRFLAIHSQRFAYRRLRRMAASSDNPPLPVASAVCWYISHADSRGVPVGTTSSWP